MTDGYYPQAMIVTNRSVLLGNVLLQGGNYVLNPSVVPPAIEHKNSHSLVVFPALVDLYSRSGEPGFETRETLSSLKQCAYQGGFHRVGIDPYQPIDRLGAVDYLRDYVPEPFLLWGALLGGGKLPEYRDFAQGVIGFAHTKPLPDLLLLRRALEYLAPYQKPVVLVAQQADLATGVMSDGYDALQLGLEGIPAIAETIAVGSIIDLVRLTRCPVHILGITCRRSLTLLEQAKDEHLPITASVIWTHLVWNTSHISTYSPHLRLHPPLPTPQDQIELIKALKTGTIDAIAINHAPYTYEEKMVPFEVTPPGTIGLQFAFSWLWTKLVKTGALTPLELLQIMQIKPAQILGISPPPAVFMLLLDQPWQLNSATSLSLAENTILWEQTIENKVITPFPAEA
jgi:dihydroorotase